MSAAPGFTHLFASDREIRIMLSGGAASCSTGFSCTALLRGADMVDQENEVSEHAPAANRWLPLLLFLAAAAFAQAVAEAAETVAKDLREDVVRIDVTVKDFYGRRETRPLPITIFRPPGDGPFPLFVFNHGRAPTASARSAQGRYRPEHAARYLVDKGFVVFVPTRIGYWETYGGFDPEESGTCSGKNFEPMSAAVSDQVLAAVEYAKTLPYVDASRWLVAGQSAGGLTAIATVGRRPQGLVAGINFAGGSGGDPVNNPERPCSPSLLERYWAGLAKNAAAPMLWLYWQNDKYWGPEIPVRWHKAWVNGGGKAQFRSFPPAGKDGHSGFTIDMEHWLPVVDEFLAGLGFNRSAIVTKPAASGFAEVGDAAKVPVSAQARAGGYAKFLELKSPRAFAVGERGGWGYASGDYAIGKAIGNCQRSGQRCKLYAVDDDVVWRAD
jgi:dienelactone hydrolase